MYDSKQIDIECRVFTRYLTGSLPNRYISEKYAEVFCSGQPLDPDPQTEFDSLLLYLATLHPFLTRAVDAFSRFFYTGSAVRKRLIVLLALLESQASTSVDLDCPDKNVFTGFIPGMVIQLTAFALLLGIATLFLLPLKLLLGRQLTRI